MQSNWCCCETSQNYRIQLCMLAIGDASLSPVSSMDATSYGSVLSFHACLQSNVTSQRVKVLGSVHACEVRGTLSDEMFCLSILVEHATRQCLLSNTPPCQHQTL